MPDPQRSEQDQRTIDAADRMADCVREIVEDRQHISLSALERILTVYMMERCPNIGQSMMPFTAIEEEIDRAGWVLRRLVAILGFQAELRVYGGDYEERGASIHRGVRITVKRRGFMTEHIEALSKFAAEHGCEIEFSAEHGVTLRLRAVREEEPGWERVEMESPTSTGINIPPIASGSA